MNKTDITFRLYLMLSIGLLLALGIWNIKLQSDVKYFSTENMLSKYQIYFINKYADYPRSKLEQEWKLNKIGKGYLISDSQIYESDFFNGVKTKASFYGFYVTFDDQNMVSKVVRYKP